MENKNTKKEQVIKKAKRMRSGWNTLGFILILAVPIMIIGEVCLERFHWKLWVIWLVLMIFQRFMDGAFKKAISQIEKENI